MKNIIFVGGIHGVGKGTICKAIARSNNIIHYSASEIIRWKEISLKENKQVLDITSTQKRLLTGLEMLIKDDNLYILDAHYCLLNARRKPERINEETFHLINPKVFAIVVEKEEVIYERLKDRDSIHYDLSLLQEFQKMEIEYAKFLSDQFNRPYIEIKDQNSSMLIKYLAE